MLRLLLILLPFYLYGDKEYEITVLATNISNYGGIGEWSFSAIFESDDESVLFDTGFDQNTVIHNAALLKVDVQKVEKVVLSHFHSDHTGGLVKLRESFMQKYPNAFSKVYIARGFFNQRYDEDGQKLEGPGGYLNAQDFKSKLESLGVEFIEISKPTEIAKNLFVTGPVERKVEQYIGPKGIFIKDGDSFIPDIVNDDQSLGYLTNKGWVMMSGCGHSGIINSGENLKAIKNVPIFGVIGGFHLWKASNKTLIDTSMWLKNSGLKKFMGGHCTGIQSAITISDIIGITKENLSHTAVGSKLTKELQILRSSVE